MKTVKFGGTSLASAEMMKHCADILKSDDARRYVIVSAPGKRFDGDIKVTDLLYRIYSEVLNDYDPEPTLMVIYQRFSEIIEGLGIAGVGAGAGLGLVEKVLVVGAVGASKVLAVTAWKLFGIAPEPLFAPLSGPDIGAKPPILEF